MNYILMTNDELKHYGIPGMKWGVRRNRVAVSTKKKKTQEIDPSYAKAHSKKKVKYMSDAELREVNNRLNMEQTYRNMTKRKSAGEKAVNAFIKTAGTLTAIAGAYATYKTVGEKALVGWKRAVEWANN